MESDLNLRLVRTDTARHIDIKTQAQAILERYITLVRFARAAIELYGTISPFDRQIKYTWRLRA